jgi:uncharacterized membrane protein
MTPRLAPIEAPLHAILLAFPIALFTTAVATDLAYLGTAQIQWTNFSAWLITGGLVFGGLVGAWAIVDLIRRRAGALVYLLLLAAMWIFGLINAFQHSKDGWSSVGAAGLILSLLTAALALAAGWVRYSRREGN